MRQLKWSQNQAGSLNGKIGHVTLFVIAYYPERGYFLAPKLPGFNKTIPVNSEEDGKRKAEVLYQRYFDFLRGAEWYQEPDYAEPTSLRPDSREKPLHRSKPSPPSGLRESNMFSPVERRRHNRLFISLPIHYQTRNPGSGEIHQGDGVIRDISLSGSYFYLHHDAHSTSARSFPSPSRPPSLPWISTVSLI